APIPKTVQQTLSFQPQKTTEVKPKATSPSITNKNQASQTEEICEASLEIEEIEEIEEQLELNALIQPDQEEFKVVAPTKTEEANLELYYIGQLHGTYLLAQNEEGLFIVDQHAAMERVQYEKNYQLLRDVSGDSVELLIPIVLKYSTNELLLLKETLPSLVKFGFEIEEFGGQSLVVRRIPIWAQKLDVKSIVETILHQIILDNKVDIGKLRESVAIMMSCKGSIKANQYINEFEIKELLQSLCYCEQPYTCPHGRPIIVNITKYEIEKLFKRVM
ncbi:MAG: DNA mismatch repair protein MutL, partial [Turicibacter sp.]|nr:DNA mismatch repair protein MutL [Turicibacter sp.]